MYNQSSSVEAVCSATYLEDYLDSLESLPDEIQRHVSEVRRYDSQYFEAMKKVKQLQDELTNFGVRIENNPPPSPDVKIELIETPMSNSAGELSPEQRRSKRMAVMKMLKYQLQRCQNIADLKLAELATINELIEGKTRQLEQDSKNMELDLNEDNASSKVVVGSSYSTDSSAASQDRSVRSIMRGFYRGDKERAAAAGASDSREDGHQQQRSAAEKQHSLNVSVAATILTSIVASEAESSEAASPSASSSTHVETASIRQGVKRPRRQKQFPDFVREVDTTSSSTNLSTNGINAASPPGAAASPAPSAPTTRSGNNKERSAGGNGNQAGKRKKKTTRQKIDAGSSGGGGGGGGKVKFNVPIDPDEPTYCLCEQVSYGEMIGCDNNDCELEWFHFNCVGLTSKPKGKWYCPNCRGDRPNIMKQQK